MTSSARSATDRWLQRLVDVRAGELAAVAWSWLFFFALLSAYYVVRPIRDDRGVAGQAAGHGDAALPPSAEPIIVSGGPR